MKNNILLDTNAILRYLLDDIHDQHLKVKEIIENKECFTILSVIQEAVYILEKYYGISRLLINESLVGLNQIITVEDEDVYLRAFDYYVGKPKLDFVDCILCAYRSERDVDVLSFDLDLNKKMEKLNK